MATTPQLWKSLHEFLQRTPSAVHLAEVNDDLVGFFNSVPRQQILDSLSRLVGLYQERDFPPHITVSLRKLSNSECAWPGKPWARGAKHLKYLHVSDLESIVSVSFKAGVFTTLGLMFRQHRGTCVGNQISPVLSSLPVIQRESCWQREWTQFLTSSRFFDTQHTELFICRYVDNRLLLADASILEHQCLQDFCNLSFYGGTIQLEEVTNHQFLGFRLDVANRTVTYMQPDKVWCIRNPVVQVAGRAESLVFCLAKPSSCNMHGRPIKDKRKFSSSGNCTGPKDSLTRCCLEHKEIFVQVLACLLWHATLYNMQNAYV